MTDSTKRNRIAPVLAALVTAMALAGCSATHVGESWQCPLAQGASCDSVAAADPAVPGAGADQRPVLREPLYRVRGTESSEAAPPARPCDAGCGAGFDPFAWLARLFGAGDADSARETPAPVADAAAAIPATATPVAESPAPAAARVPESAADDAAVAPEPPADTAALPASAAPARDLRTGEAIGRIWIAPFVDADGVYREAAHVRVVLEPAGWRLK